MYSVFSRLTLTSQNVKDALNYVEKYCYSFHLSLIQCNKIVNKHVTFMDSEMDDDSDPEISDVIPIDEEECAILMRAITRIEGMSYTYEKLADIVHDLINAYYDKTHDSNFISTYKSYKYAYVVNGNHEKVRRLYVDDMYNIKMAAVAMMKYLYSSPNSDNQFFSAEYIDLVQTYIDKHEEEFRKREIERIMHSTVDDWKKIFEENMKEGN